jgi:glycerol kinase
MTDAPLTLAIDQGTHSSRAIVFDHRGAAIAKAQQPVSLTRLSRHRVEQRSVEILRATRGVVDAVLRDPRLRDRRVRAAGIATQRSSVLAWDSEYGTPLSPVLSWQDRRAYQWLKTLEADSGEIQRRTGLRLTPHYGASKLRWLVRENAAVKRAAHQGRLMLGPLVSFLLRNLLSGDGGVVDHANAGRTQLLNIETRDWDRWLLERFEILVNWLPQSVPVHHDFGTLRDSGVPVTAVNGDQNAALFAFGPVAPDTVVVNLGTGAFVLLPTAGRRVTHDRLLSGIATSDAGHTEYIIEGTVNGAGSALRWAAQRLGLDDVRDRLAPWLAQTVAPVLFLNTVGGLGSPWWADGPDPGWVSLTGQKVVDAEPAAAVVAVAESILFHVKKNLDAICDSGLAYRSIRATGGLAQVDGLCQRLADLSDCPVERPPQLEATAKGIAWLAAGRPSGWAAPGAIARFEPRPNPGLCERFMAFQEVLRVML